MRNIWCLCLGLFLWVGVSFADPAQELFQLLSSVHSMTANFSQQLVGRNVRNQPPSSGTFELLKPGRFRWDIQTPSNQVMIADGLHLWDYDVDLQQVTQKNLQSTIRNTPAMILTSVDPAWLQDYDIQYLGNSGYALRARDNQATFSAVDIYFTQGQLSHMQLTDNFGQVSSIDFSQVVINPPINPHDFYFVPPPDVDVIQR